MRQRPFFASPGWLAALAGIALVAGAAQWLSGGSGRNAAPPSLPPSEAAFFDDPVAPAITPEGYDLTIVIYSDYQCPYCRALDGAVHRLIEEDSHIRVVFRDWPVLGPASMEAARAAIASQWQGKHPEFHKALMALPGRLSTSAIRTAAEETGVDWPRLQADLTSHAAEIDALIARNTRQAAQLGFIGTPALLIGRYRVPGAVDLPRLREIVQLAREEQANRPRS